jgi:hypothetical protein
MKQRVRLQRRSTSRQAAGNATGLDLSPGLSDQDQGRAFASGDRLSTSGDPGHDFNRISVQTLPNERPTVSRSKRCEEVRPPGNRKQSLPVSCRRCRLTASRKVQVSPRSFLAFCRRLDTRWSHKCVLSESRLGHNFQGVRIQPAMSRQHRI